MKKYLMTGVAAIAMCVAFTSCSKTSDLYDANAVEQQKVEAQKAAYAAAFEKAYGKVGANVDWGFSSKSTRTRANSGVDYPSTSTGINANANEWADPDKEFGGWVVPAPLTDGQKLRVQKYFQANPNLDYDDPEWRHFFVQQVYKGNTDAGANSTETITAANGSVYDSNNMNLLTVGANNQHINNFNGGDCTTRKDVLDNGGNVNNGPFHSDQIMLMVNIDDTSCFGYHETGSSTHHNDKAALVSAETIDAWAALNGNPGEAVVDDWNRSFLGFDLAIKEGAQAYETDNSGNVIYATYAQAAESPQYAWDGEKIIQIADGYNTDWTPKYLEGYETIQNIGWLTTNKNFYVAADQVIMSQTVSVNRAQVSELSGYYDAPVLKDVMDGDTYRQSVINLPKIKKLVEDGYLPVNNKSLTEWVKVGESDGYFTDWIVTLTEAQRYVPTETHYRVIAEDLNATEKSDFDFNDVVFDVIKAENGKTILKLQACGGIYKLTVAGQEVHELFGEKADATTGLYKMINTGAGPNYPAKEFEIDGEYSTPEQIKNIVIVVYKPGFEKGIELEATTGKPACKILVDDTFGIVRERDDISNEYKNFTKYVGGSFTDAFWWKKN